MAAVVVLLLALAIMRCAAEPMIVQGDGYVYSIPASYEKKSDFFWTLAGYEGDPALVTYLQIPLDEVPQLVGLYRFRLLLFHEKSYGMDSLTNYGNSIAEESVEAAKSGDLHRYTKKTTTETTDYYFTFDPTVLGTSHVAERDFLALVRMREPLTIGGESTTPRPGCEVHFLYDGISIEASVGGAVCAPRNLMKIRGVVEKLMEEWKSEEASLTSRR